MGKRSSVLLSLILVLILFIPTLSFGEGLEDLETSLYKEEILKLIEDEALSGYPDGTFRPENSITRGEFAKMTANALDLEQDKENAEHFEDVVGKWHEGYIGAVYKAGLMEGTGKSTFKPEENITREQMIAVIVRGLEMEELAKRMDLEPEFEDKDSISLWAKSHVALAQKIGLLDGIIDGDKLTNFNPKDFADRQTVAKLTYELVYNKDLYEKNFVSFIKTLEKSDENQQENDKKDTGDVDKETDNKNGKLPEESKEEKPSYDSIVSKYRDELTILQSKYMGELIGLLEQAKMEYEQGGKPSQIFDKYESIALELEGQADAEVSDVLSQLTSELEKHGYDTSVIGELQREYEEIKSETESEILNP